MTEMAKESFRMDCGKVEEEIVCFIKRVVSEAKADGVVLGLSGGVDSSVVVALCVKALGKEKVLGLLMPAGFTPSEDQADAKALASDLDIRTCVIPLGQIVDKFLESMPLKDRNRVAVGNVYARMRMVINYFIANSLNYLVCGTGNRSESLIGYFTKYGDGGVDILPIGHLYKTQVRELGKHLGLPSKIVDKPASPQLWKGQKATDEIPIDYPILDQILYDLFDREMSIDNTAKQLEIKPELIKTVRTFFERSHHKRAAPPMPQVP